MRPAIPRWSTAPAPANYDRAAYTAWLKALREVCTERGIVLIFDEVFVGFRLAAGGAQEYFGVRADMVTYGKSLAGGLPIGVVCGRKDLMRRFRDDRPADVCFARGTFNSHPYVMTAMDEFLTRLGRSRLPQRSMTELTNAGMRGREHLNELIDGGEVCRSASAISLRSGWSIIPSRPATTGCFNITCGPKDWR